MILDERFWSKVAKQGDGCWMWLGQRDGQFWFPGGRHAEHAHRLTWESTNGALPPGKMIGHTCGKRLCVNPAHMALVPRWRQTEAATKAQVKPTRESTIARFMEKIKRAPAPSTCWLWQAARHGVPGSYGFFYLDGVYESAHRASHKIFKGPIPIGLVVSHSCDVPQCVNPDHLSAVTQRENMLDRDAKGRGARGSKHPNATSEEEEVAAMRGEYMAGRDGELTRIANKYGKSLSVACAILKGKSWKHVKVPLGSTPSGDPAYVRPYRGERHHKSKLTAVAVVELRHRASEGEGDGEKKTALVNEFVERFGVRANAIYDILNGKTWKGV